MFVYSYFIATIADYQVSNVVNVASFTRRSGVIPMYFTLYHSGPTIRGWNTKRGAETVERRLILLDLISVPTISMDPPASS